MRIIVAMDSFKGTAGGRAAGEAVASGLQAAEPQADLQVLAVADGGEGTVDAFNEAVGGDMHRICVHGPLCAVVTAPLLMCNGKTAVIEMASAAGLPLVPEKLRNPMNTSSLGVGELIRAALDAGAQKLLLGLGGSATVDGGLGAAAALGVCFNDENEAPVSVAGRGLLHVAAVDMSGLDERINDLQVLALADVDNPLLGERGAARTFAAQKGASEEEVELLEEGMERLAGIASAAGLPDAADTPGAGAAGGLGFGLAAFLRAQIVSGAGAILDAWRFDELVVSADLVITGEGCLDEQTGMGKLPEAVRRRAGEAGVPCCAIVGCFHGADAGRRFDGAWSLVELLGQEFSLKHTLVALEKAGKDLFPEIKKVAGL